MLDYRTFRRFWAHVRKTPTCWLWTCSLPKHGYGQFQVGEKMWRTHRLAYTFRYGPIPEGQLVLHRCDVKHCVRPSHLFLGSQADNIRDMDTKGRRGDMRHYGSRRFNAFDLLAILAKPYTYGSATRLAREKGVHVNTVYRIRKTAAAGRSIPEILRGPLNPSGFPPRD